MYVCMYVYLSAPAILGVRAIKSIMKDVIALSIRFTAILIKMACFFLNCLIRKLERLLFTLLSVTCLLTHALRLIIIIPD